MAGTLTKVTVVDGARNHVVSAHIGGDANLSASNLVDVSGLSGAPSEVKVTKIQWSFQGLNAQLLWDATSNVVFAELADGEGELCFDDFGGLINNAGAGVTGDVLISTTGLASGDVGTIVLHCKKR